MPSSPAGWSVWELLIPAIRPNLRLDRLAELTPERLKSLGDIRAAVFDLDDTIMRSHAGRFEPEMIAQLRALQASGIRLAVVTNNSREAYCQSAESQLAAVGLKMPFVWNGRKPHPIALAALQSHFGLKPGQVVMVGDNPLTDVLAARRQGMKTVLAEWFLGPEQRAASIFGMLRRIPPFVRDGLYLLTDNMEGPQYWNMKPPRPRYMSGFKNPMPTLG